MPKDFAKVYLVKTDDRKEGIASLLENFDILDFKDRNIALKANYNSSDPFPASTHLDTLNILVRSIKAAGPKTLILAERSDMGDTRRVLETRGL